MKREASPGNNRARFLAPALFLVSFLPVLPFLFGTGYPKHDTLAAFQFFSYVESYLQGSGEFPAWIPYLSFGMPSSLNDIIFLGPSQHFALLLARLAGGPDDLFFFAVSLALEIFAFASGLFLLGRALGLTRGEAALVAIIGIAATNPLRQIHWSLHVFGALPLLFWMVLKFLRDADWRILPALLIYGTCFVLFGQLPYSVVVQFYVVLFWAAAVALLHRDTLRQNWSPFFSRRARVSGHAGVLAPGILTIAAAIAVSALALYFSLARDVSAHSIIASEGRDAGGQTASLADFLHYGGLGQLSKFANLFIADNRIHDAVAHADVAVDDFTLFIGKLAFAALVLGAVFFRRLAPSERRAFLALGATALAVLLFCSPIIDWPLPFAFDNPIAMAAYYLPGMGLVRHLAFFSAIVKILLLLALPFALRAALRARFAVPLLLAAAALLVACDPIKPSNLALLLVPLCLLAKTENTRARILLAAVLAEVALFALTLQTPLSLAYDRHAWPMVEASPRASPFPQRQSPEESAAPNRYLVATLPHGSFYTLANAFQKQDACLPKLRQDDLPRNFFALMGASQAALARNPALSLDVVGPALLGCGADKIAAVGQVQWSTEANAAADLSAKIAAQNWQSAIAAGKSPLPDPAASAYAAPAAVNIANTGFGANHAAFTIDNTAQTKAFIIYRDGNHPWWTAALDGAALPIYAADVAFKGVEIPPGRHALEFRIAALPRFALWSAHALLALAQILLLVFLTRALRREGARP